MARPGMHDENELQYFVCAGKINNMNVATDTLTIALITEVFPGEESASYLNECLGEAKRRGARLAIMPELPLDPWIPVTKDARDEDAEQPGGPRHQRMATAAREAGIGLLGSAIVEDIVTRKRYNTALMFDESGRLISAYRKAHLPAEEGYWETSHYEAGDDPPSVIESFGMPVGLQICSDINRPEGSHLLGAMGAEAILCPRANSFREYERWKVVFRANALTSAAYVISVNRPRPEFGVGLGGPSVVVAPGGEVVLETTEPVAVCTLSRYEVRRAREAYPGYLPVRARYYAEAWDKVARSKSGK